MVTTTMEWIRVAWRNESRKEQISPKKGSEKAIRKVEATVSFDEGNVIINKESCTEWEKEWKKLGNIFNKGHKGTSSFKVKYQSNIKKKTLAGLNVTMTTGKHRQYSQYKRKRQKQKQEKKSEDQQNVANVGYMGSIEKQWIISYLGAKSYQEQSM